MLNAKLGCEMRSMNKTDRSCEDIEIDFESVESRSELNLVDNCSNDDADDNDREMDVEDLIIRDEFNAYSTIDCNQIKPQNLPQSASAITTSNHQNLQRSLSDNSLECRLHPDAHQPQQKQSFNSIPQPSIYSSLLNTSLFIRRHKSLSPSPNNKYDYKASICAQSIEIEYLLHNAVFFLARSSAQNIELAKRKSYWTTTKHIEQIYDETFDRAAIVILIFIETEGDHFCGFARICSKALYRGQPALCWKEFNGGGNIKIEWISKSSLHISNTQHLTNHHKKVYMAQDGSKIEASVGRALCGLFALDDKSIDVVDLRRRILRGNGGCEAINKRLLDGDEGSAYKHSIPSLFDDPVSYDQFKRAKRNLTNQEYDTSISNPPSLLHHFHNVFLPSNERKYDDLNGPVPLMDVSLGSSYSLTVRSPPSKSFSYTHRDNNDKRYSISRDHHNYKIGHHELPYSYQSPSNHRRHTSRSDSYRRIPSNDSKISKTKHAYFSSQKPINDYDFKYKRKRF